MKTVNSWRAPRFLSAPIFCEFLAWRAGTTRPGQYGALWAHLSQATVRPQLLSIYTFWRLHLQETTPSGEENISEEQRGTSRHGLCQAKKVRRCFIVWTCIFLNQLVFKKGWQFPTKKLFRGRRNWRKNWFFPTEFRLFRGRGNSRNSVPNHSAEEKNVWNSVP